MVFIVWIMEIIVEDILTIIKREKGTCTVIHRTDNRGTTRVTEWQPKDGKRRQDRQKTRQRDEIGSFAGLARNR